MSDNSDFEKFIGKRKAWGRLSSFMYQTGRHYGITPNPFGSYLYILDDPYSWPDGMDDRKMWCWYNRAGRRIAFVRRRQAADEGEG